MTRTRVLWLIKGLGYGGAEKLLTIAAPYLNRDRFQYEAAYLLPEKSALVPELERAGIPVHCLGQRSRTDPMVLWRLVRLLSHRRPDVLHMHLPYAGILGSVATRFSRVPVTVYTEHSGADQYHRLTSLVHRRLYKWKDYVICVSDAVRGTVEAQCHVNGKPRLRTIYNGVDWADIARLVDPDNDVRAALGIQDGQQMVLTVANFRPEKRHVDLIEACQAVLAQRSDVIFVLVGDGPERPAVEAAVRQRGIEGSVRFTGTRRDALSFISQCDLFVLPSSYEGLGISVLEALALGRPVVATRVGGIPEVVRDGIDGLLVQSRNPARLAEAILKVLDDPELQERFAGSAKDGLRDQFEIATMVRQVESVYEEGLAARGAA